MAPLPLGPSPRAVSARTCSSQQQLVRRSFRRSLEGLRMVGRAWRRWVGRKVRSPSPVQLLSAIPLALPSMNRLKLSGGFERCRIHSARSLAFEPQDEEAPSAQRPSRSDEPRRRKKDRADHPGDGVRHGAGRHLRSPGPSRIDPKPLLHARSGGPRRGAVPPRPRWSPPAPADCAGALLSASGTPRSRPASWALRRERPQRREVATGGRGPGSGRRCQAGTGANVGPGPEPHGTL